MSKRVVMIAGGTGGHIVPALTVAHALSDCGCQVHWLGSTGGMEQQLVSPHFPIVSVAAGRIRGKGVLTKLLSPVKLALATWQAARALFTLKPDLVVAMGGFVSAPGGLAAKLLRKRLLIHEQNAVAGYTNRVLARFADVVLCAYPQAFSPKVLTTVVGNPVAATISSAPQPAARQLGQRDQLHLLVLGGSQGAVAINQLLLSTLADFKPRAQLAVWHQCGEAHVTSVRQAYRAMDYIARVDGFIKTMSEAYQWADIVICRAGALTISELCACGVASLLIPYPYAVDNHQWFNAQPLLDSDAAWRIDQAKLTPAALQSYIKQWLCQKDLCLNKAVKARSLAKPKATETFVKACLTLIEK